MPPVFESPSRDVPHGETVYQVTTGEDTVFPINDRGISLQQIPDGFSNTALIVEADAGHSVPWTKPQDLTFDPARPRAGLSLAAEFNVVLADGWAATVPISVDEDLWTKLVTRNDGEFVDLLQLAPPPASADSLQQLALAALSHEAATQRFPLHAIYSDDGQPLLSWRVKLLPYIDQLNLYNEFHLDEPWDSPHNITLLPKMPRIYAHPLVSRPKTNYLALVGENTVLRTPLDPSDPRTFGRGTTLREITDGLPNTVVFAEADPDQAVEWSKPQDIAYNSAHPLNGVGSIGEYEFHLALADGSVRAIPNVVTGDKLHRLVTRNDGEFVDPSFADSFESAEYNLRRLTTAAWSRGHLPAHAIYSEDGQPLLSWRVAILPYLGYAQVYEQFHLDEPWDSPHNLALLPQMPRVYAHPQVPGFKTNYLAMTGENTAFPIAAEGLRHRDFLDGLSNTLLFVEADADPVVEWTKPQDILFDRATPLTGLSNIVEAGFHVVFADGSTRLLSNDVNRDQFTSVVSVNDELDLPADRSLGDVNLDGVVDALDFAIIRQNLFQPPELVHNWHSGDLNGDGGVDGSDFNLWLDNRFLANPPVARVAPALRAALRQNHAVPESAAVHVATPSSRERLDAHQCVRVDVPLRPPTGAEADGYFAELGKRSIRPFFRRAMATDGSPSEAERGLWPQPQTWLGLPAAAWQRDAPAAC